MEVPEINTSGINYTYKVIVLVGVLLAGVLLALAAPAVLAQDAGDFDIDVTLDPVDGEAEKGEIQTYEVLVSDADVGIGAYELALSLDDPGVGEIVDFDLVSETEFDDSEIAGDGQSMTLAATLGDEYHDEADTAGEDFTIATVDVEAVGDAGTATGLTLDSVEDGFEVAEPGVGEGDDPSAYYNVVNFPSEDASFTVADDDVGPEAFLSVEEGTVAPGEEAELEIFVEVPDGDPEFDDVAVIEFDASVDDSVGKFTDVEEYDGLADHTVEEDFISFSVFGAEFEDASDPIVVGKVTVEAIGDDGDETVIEIDEQSVSLTDERGGAGEYDPVETIDGSVSIVEAVDPDPEAVLSIEEGTVAPGEQAELEIFVEVDDPPADVADVAFVEFDASIDNSVARFVDAEAFDGTEDHDVANDSVEFGFLFAELDGADDGLAVGSLTVEAVGNSSEETAVEVDHESVDVGDETGASYAPIEISDGMVSIDKLEPEASLSVAEGTVAPGEETELDILVEVDDPSEDVADVATVEFEASIDESVARFVDAEAFDGTEDHTVENNSLDFAIAFAEFDAAEETSVGTVTVEGVGEMGEETDIEIDPETASLFDESAIAYDPVELSDGNLSILDQPVSLEFHPTSSTVFLDEDIELDIVVEGANRSAGVGAVEFEASIDDSVARFVDAETFDGTEEHTVEDDFLSYAFAFAEFDPAEEIVLGTVTVESAHALGNTTLDIDSNSVGLFDQTGGDYLLNEVTGAELTVEIDVNGNGLPAQDLTGDGLFDDVIGDGQVAAADAQALFFNRDALNEPGIIDSFDFVENGQVGGGDAQRLFFERDERNP